LCSASKGWFHHDSDEYTLDHSIYPPAIHHRLIRRNESDGWQQLFLGRFSNKWSDIQENFFAQKAGEEASVKTNTKKQMGLRWQAAIIGLLSWDQWWAVWET
jgi:hypothetical protein